MWHLYLWYTDPSLVLQIGHNRNIYKNVALTIFHGHH